MSGARLMAVFGTMLAMAGAMFTTNPGLTALAIAALYFVFSVTWRSKEIPALTFACVMQWIASSLPIFDANRDGIAVWQRSYARQIDEAIVLSLAAVCVFALGARAGLGWKGIPIRDYSATSPSVDRRIVWFWLATLVLEQAMYFVDRGGFSQIARTLMQLQALPVFMLCWIAVQRGRNFSVVALVLALSIGSGFLGFFSTFKLPIYLLTIAILGAQATRLSFRRLLMLGGLVMFALTLGIVWTAIKPRYRSFMNQGTREQVVTVSKQQQVDELFGLVGSLERDDFEDAADDLSDRISYVELFGATLDYVPSMLPHEHGQRMIDAFQHVLMPRVFFPDKKALDDTADTERYTGYTYSYGTSVSVGYAAEAYIDGGVAFMFFPIVFFGWLYGWTSRRLMRLGTDPLMAGGFVVIQLLTVLTLELGFKKLLGAAIVQLILFELALRYVTPRISAWIWGAQTAVATQPIERSGRPSLGHDALRRT